MAKKNLTGAEVLDLPMFDNAAGAQTIRAYLKALLNKLWEKEEGFSGKRPFGNSGWSYDLYWALAKADAIEAEIFDYGGEDGEQLRRYDQDAADELIFSAIEAL